MRKKRTWMPKLRAATHQDRREKRQRTRRDRDEAEIQAELEADAAADRREQIAAEREDRDIAKSHAAKELRDILMGFPPDDFGVDPDVDEILNKMTAQDQEDGWWTPTRIKTDAHGPCFRQEIQGKFLPPDESDE